MFNDDVPFIRNIKTRKATPVMPNAIEMREIIHKAVSFETAHVQEYYPFGRERCLRKIWVETAVKGAKKDQQRVVTCTTKKQFNAAYTEEIASKGLKLFDDSTGAPLTAELGILGLINISHVIERMAGHWNKPHPGQYSMMKVLYKVPVGDRIFVKAFGLGIYSQPVAFAAFKAMLAGDNLAALTEVDERARYESVEKYNRSFHAIAWQEWIKLMDAERATATEELVRQIEGTSDED